MSTPLKCVLLLPLLGALLGGARRVPQAGAGGAGQIEAFIVAHPDDWQLFMGDVAVRAIRGGSHVVFVYTTAGDAGRPAAYWLTRERGALASIAWILGFAPPDSTDADDAPGPGALCADTVVTGHGLRRCRIGAATSYFLRLPDGNVRGQGFASTGSRSLSRFADGAVSGLTALRGGGAYTRWRDLLETVTTLLRIEAAAGPGSTRDVRIHAPDPDTAFNPGDHADHRATGRLAAGVARAGGWSLCQYAGYATARWPTNLSAEQFATKAALFVAYDRVQVLADSTWGSSVAAPRAFSQWLSRTYVHPHDVTGCAP